MPAATAPGGFGPNCTAAGHAVGRYALRTWLRQHGLRALSTRPQWPRIVVAENRLLGQQAPTAQNQVWVGDITYLLSVGGRWCYLARCLLPAGRGLALGRADATELVLKALEQALTLRQPASGLVIHADRGSQYTSHACRQCIEAAGRWLATLGQATRVTMPRPKLAGAL